MRKGTPLAVEDLDRLVQPVERPRCVGDRHDLDAPVGGVLAVGRVDAQDQVRARLRRPAATSTGSKLSIETRCPASRRAATASPTPAQGPPGSQPRSIRSAPSPSEPRGAGEQLVAIQPGGVVDLGEDLDVVGPVTFEPRRRLAEAVAAGRGGLRGRVRPAVPGLLGSTGEVARQWPGRITRSIPAGTSRCRATHFGVIKAATEIGRTATSATKPARGASSSSTCRSANSASRPVTNRNEGGRTIGSVTIPRSGVSARCHR